MICGLFTHQCDKNAVLWDKIMTWLGYAEQCN